MGERNSVYVFKGPTVDVFREAASRAVTDLGGHLNWDTHPDPMAAKILTSHNDCIHAAYIHRKGYAIAKMVGARLAIPWINVRIQEGSLWDYSLYEREAHLDDFSTWPEYWDDDPDWLATQRGQPDVLAKAWQIEQSSVREYLRAWIDESIQDQVEFGPNLRGKAYPSDESEYGDIWQMTDFLRALGAHDPNFDQPYCIPRHLEFASKKRRWRFWRR